MCVRLPGVDLLLPGVTLPAAPVGDRPRANLRGGCSDGLLALPFLRWYALEVFMNAKVPSSGHLQALLHELVGLQTLERSERDCT